MSVDLADDVTPDQHGLVCVCDQSGLRVRDSLVDGGGWWESLATWWKRIWIPVVAMAAAWAVAYEYLCHLCQTGNSLVHVVFDAVQTLSLIHI